MLPCGRQADNKNFNADATQVAKASMTVVLDYFTKNIPLSASEVVTLVHFFLKKTFQICHSVIEALSVQAQTRIRNIT